MDSKKDSNVVTLKEALSAGNLRAAGYIPGQAPGAILNGARVEKINASPGDAHGNGARGTVRSSLGPIEVSGRMTIGYFVIWDDMPDVPIGITDNRIREIKSNG